VVADLLEHAEFRKADVFFDREYTLDLGGVRVRMLSLGPTHTRGDNRRLGRRGSHPLRGRTS